MDYIYKEQRAIQTVELHPNKGQKSFYGKALVHTTDKRGFFLQSYNTIVCGVVNGQFIKLWNGYSATTLRHINAFRKVYDRGELNKREWEALEVEA